MENNHCANFSVAEKKFYKMGEACDVLGVRPHVLRYWETEFSQVQPYKSKSGQRLYRREDMVNLARIYQLLYRDKFTIAGARQALITPASTEIIELPVQVATEPEHLVEPPTEAITPAIVKIADTRPDLRKQELCTLLSEIRNRIEGALILFGGQYDAPQSIN